MLRKGLLILGTVCLGLASEAFTPEPFAKEANAQAPEIITQQLIQTEEMARLETEDLWKDVYSTMISEDEVFAQAVEVHVAEKEKAKAQEVQLMSVSTDHIVNYHGKRFSVTDDDYQMLLRLVEAEARGEDLKGKMLVVSVVLNRLEVGFSGADTVGDVIFAKGQFSPVGNGRIFKMKVSEETVEAVERVLNGEDYSKGALYFMARDKASARGIRWFDSQLKYLFTHGGHEFYKEK